MRLRTLELNEFRSFRRLFLPLQPAGFRAVGPNASGKSTLLEAMAMLATTRSPRTSAEREIANWQSGSDLAIPPYARLRAEFERGDGSHHIEIGLTLDGGESGSLKKRTRFDDRSVRSVDAVGQLKTVLFSPQDVDLISGSPNLRRRYLDMAVSQASRSYLRALSRYNRVLEQRNSLLRGFARERVSSEALGPAQEMAFWNAELISTAVDVMAMRLGAVNFLNSRAKFHFSMLTGDESLSVAYVAPRVNLPEEEWVGVAWPATPQSIRQALAASFAASLERLVAEELRRGITVIGPHRDDIEVMASGVDLGRFGSRGQQRLAVLAIKLGELDLLEDAGGETPVLLLDDVLSELDGRHREKLVNLLSARDAQICVTSTDDRDLASPGLSHLPRLRVADGAVG